ncbi:MAG: hypothetical protein UT24_C0003G0064 [Candidatus Woesebacteria bacterium GW2011_GWB1_39_12]|uniref:DUF5131 family protein n=1 Tax=Candidatus Woesebacteria bacterium GW2011_GWB1_39_12 TaxID=1618574 RepID=A0A0G0QIZ5_9BACT|nr:MAG: hypothetical protein UT24_C0003G0064 [Candidatus Woesebacteria bacterium GW2011_GWB1_39_12]
MNKQKKYVNGKLVSRGIEWTDYTINAIAGCKHGCAWLMTDGKAPCYAETTAEGVASSAYPQGFAHHYYYPERLDEPLSVKEPSRIFLDSMSDVGGFWVPDEQRRAVLIDMPKKAYWHTFQSLTKNPKGLLGIEFPQNVWVGVSTPPDVMWGHALSMRQKLRKLEIDLQTLREIKVKTKWYSIEPLSLDCAEQFRNHGLDWAVIGAASNGAKKYQPNPDHLNKLLEVMDEQHTPLFFKGNLIHNPHREEYPK